MVKKFEFQARVHPEWHVLGFALEGIANADPMDGIGCAHDILEHFPGGDIGAADEFMAFGAMLWLRGPSWAVPPAFQAHEFPGILEHVINEGHDIPSLMGQPLLPEWAEKRLAVTMTRARIECHKHFLNERMLSGERASTVDYLDKLIYKGLEYMRHGFHRAVARYKKHERWEVENLFNTTRDTINRCLVAAEYGDRLTVTIDFDALTVGAQHAMGVI